MFLSVRRHVLAGDSRDLSVCQNRMLEDVSNFLEQQEPQHLIKNRSRSVKEKLSNLAAGGPAYNHPFSWQMEVGLSTSVGSHSSANFRSTGKASCQSCQAPEELYFHLAVNNREAIGTNLLRSGLASSRETRPGRMVLITLGRNLLNLGGWDGAYGDSSEFITQYGWGYQKVLKDPPIILEVNCLNLEVDPLLSTLRL